MNADMDDSLNVLGETLKPCSTDPMTGFFIEQERWGGNVTCPHCGHEKVYRVKGKMGFKCAGCRKQFSVRTGSVRDGCCNTGPMDHGKHTVCRILTEAFLAFSKSVGNDLSTPRSEFGFDGLKDGDRWCLCADRWAQTDANGVAPMWC